MGCDLEILSVYPDFAREEIDLSSRRRKLGLMQAMTASQLLEQLQKLAPWERLEVAEALIHELRSEMKAASETKSGGSSSRLAQAARELVPDYAGNAELTAFTVLDNEPFHA